MKRLSLLLFAVSGCAPLDGAGLWATQGPPLPAAAAGWTGGLGPDGSLHAYHTAPWTSPAAVERADSAYGTFEPRVDAGRVAWTDSRNGNRDVYVLDLVSGTETRVDTSSANQDFPDIDGDLVVFTDDRNGTSDVYAWSLSSAMLISVSTGAGRQSNAVVSEGRVCWEHDPSGSSLYAEIWCRVLGVGTAQQIVPEGSQNKRNPSLDGDLLVWEHASGHIRGWDFGAGTPLTITTALPSGPQGHVNPAVSGGRVAYQSDNGQWDIYLHEIASGTTTLVAADGSQQVDPRLSGEFVVWTDYRNGNADVYGAHVARPIPMVIFAGNGTNEGVVDVDGEDLVYTDLATRLLSSKVPRPSEGTGLFELAPGASSWALLSTAGVPFVASGTTMLDGAFVECGLGTQLDTFRCTRFVPESGSWALSTPHTADGAVGAADRLLVAAMDGHVYVMGEEGAARWNPGEDSWTDIAPLSFSVSGALAVVTAGRLHVLNFPGAQDNVFDPFQNAWTATPLTGTFPACPSIAHADGDLFVVSGTEELGSLGLGSKRSSYSKVSRLPTPRFNACPIGDGSRVYVLGGFSDGTLTEAVDAVDIFVP